MLQRDTGGSGDTDNRDEETNGTSQNGVVVVAKKEGADDRQPTICMSDVCPCLRAYTQRTYSTSNTITTAGLSREGRRSSEINRRI
jgi:hypothetical protein